MSFPERCQRNSWSNSTIPNVINVVFFSSHNGRFFRNRRERHSVWCKMCLHFIIDYLSSRCDDWHSTNMNGTSRNHFILLTEWKMFIERWHCRKKNHLRWIPYANTHTHTIDFGIGCQLLLGRQNSSPRNEREWEREGMKKKQYNITAIFFLQWKRWDVKIELILQNDQTLSH